MSCPMKKLVAGIAVTALFFIFQTSWANAVPILSIQPPETNVGLGETFSLDVMVSDVEDLFGFQFNLLFNPGILSGFNLSLGPFLGSDGAETNTFLNTINNSTGTASFGAQRLSPDGNLSGTGSGILASIDFTSQAVGTSPIAFSDVGLYTALPGTDGAVTYSSIDHETQDGLVTVSTASVPEPPAWVLLGTGLLFVGLLGRKRAHSKTC
jgi:hypothetical protein